MTVRPSRTFNGQLIYDMINDRAVETWKGPGFSSEEFKQDYNQWIKHWFKSAEDIRHEFEAEGLLETAQFVKDWIATNQRFCEGDYGDDDV